MFDQTPNLLGPKTLSDLGVIGPKDMYNIYWYLEAMMNYPCMHGCSCVTNGIIPNMPMPPLQHNSYHA